MQRQLTEDERREAENLRAARLVLLQRNPLASVVPYPKQSEFLESREHIKAFFGGNGSGKTWVGIVDDLVQLCDEESLPSGLRPFKRWQPPFYLRVVAPKWGVIEGVLLEKFRELTPKDQLFGGSFDAAFKKQHMKLQFANGSWVVFNTTDQDRDAHAGIELHRVHFDEEPEGDHGRGIYTENVARLRRFMPDAQIMFTMTPLFGLSWTFDEVWERREESDVFCTVASMRDNPHIDADSMIRALSHLSDAERRAVVEGEFVHFQGAVLREWDDERNVCPPVVPAHLKGQDIIVGIDPGIARAGISWSAFDKDNHQLVFDEFYPANEDALPKRLAGFIRAKNRAWGLNENDITYVIDPSARNRTLVEGENVEGAFAREGIYCVHGQNPRRAGILELKARVQSGALIVSRVCEKTLWERARWVVDRDESDVSRDTDDFKTKGPHHIWDAIRYSAMHRPWANHGPFAATPQRRPIWTPGTAPPASWLDDGGPLESPPMGAMS